MLTNFNYPRIYTDIETKTYDVINMELDTMMLSDLEQKLVGTNTSYIYSYVSKTKA